MALDTTIQVKEVQTETKTSKKGTSYESLRITDTNDNIYMGFVNEDTEIPEVGQSVKVFYNENGKYKNIVSLGVAKKAVTTKTTKSAPWATKETTQTTTQLITPSSKDISMEVSGLLQAIITHHGLDGDTSTRLRTALKLKREVASELETKGSV
jgi:hypothetical protein